MRSPCFPILFALAFGLLAGCSSPEEKAASHLASANALLADNQLQKARVEYANALQINQNLPGAWYGLARIYERQGKWKDAYKVLLRIRDTNPKYLDARVLLTKLLLASNQIDQALEDANDIVALSPDDARAHAIMASVRLRTAELDAARAAVERALSLDPRNDEALQMNASLLIADKQYRQALQFLDDALQASPDNESLYLLKLTALSELGDDSAIEQTYETLIRTFPDQQRFKFALVQRYVAAGNIDQAERVLMRDIAEKPNGIDEKLRLVVFRSQHRSLDDAIELVRSYLEEDQADNRYGFVLGELYLRNGQTEQAIELYRGIASQEQLANDGLEARNRIARIYLESANIEASRQLVDEVLAHDRNNQEGLLLRARFQLLEQNYTEAVTTLRTVLRDNPQSVEALDLIARGHLAMGADRLAIEALGEALALEPESAGIAVRLAALLIRSNQPEQAVEVLMRSIESGNDTVDAVRLLTQASMMLGNWEQAEQLAQRLQSFEGQQSASQHVLGLVYKNRQQNQESIAAFRRAHDLDPAVSEPVVALVQIYLENRQPDRAREFLNSVVEENPGNARAYQMLGQLSLSEDDMPAAIRYLERATAADPRLDSAYLQLASIYLGENQLDKAQDILEKGLTELPANLKLAMNLALTVERQGDIDRAIELYENLLQASPGIMVAKNNLASLLLDHRGDAASIDRARELAAGFKDANLSVFRDTYAWASIKSGSFLEEAIVILKNILRDDEAIGLYHYHLGEAYRKNGNKFEARKSLRRAIELEAPGSPIAAEAEKSLQLVSQ